MQNAVCVKVPYLVCSTGVLSFHTLKLVFCKLVCVSRVHTLHFTALECMTSLYPFWCNNGGPLNRKIAV